MMPETSAVAVVGGLDTSASEALPLPPVSIFMQAVEWLLKVKVVTVSVSMFGIDLAFHFPRFMSYQ